MIKTVQDLEHMKNSGTNSSSSTRL